MQYKGVSKLCTYYKHQGKNNMTYTIKRMDDEFKKKKEQEEAATNSEIHHQNNKLNTKNQPLSQGKTPAQKNTKH